MRINERWRKKKLREGGGERERAGVKSEFIASARLHARKFDKDVV